MSKLFIFDVETTGLEASRHGIHQLSAMIVIDGVVQGEQHWNIQPFPEDAVNPDALSISGTTPEMLSGYSKPQQVYSQLSAWLNQYVDRYDKADKLFLCGYNNLAFDNDFLRAFFLKNGDKYFGSYFFSGGLDAMALATLHLMDVRGRMPNFKLATVAHYMGIDVNEEKLHLASYDLMLTYEILKNCKIKI